MVAWYWSELRFHIDGAAADKGGAGHVGAGIGAGIGDRDQIAAAAIEIKIADDGQRAHGARRTGLQDAAGIDGDAASHRRIDRAVAGERAAGIDLHHRGAVAGAVEHHGAGIDGDGLEIDEATVVSERAVAEREIERVAAHGAGAEQYCRRWCRR